MVIPRHIVPLAVLLVLGGCFSPAGWTLRLEDKVECGMTVEEVQALTSRTVQEHDGLLEGFLWETHYIADRWETHDVGLGFENGRLRFVQVSWINSMQSGASYPRVDLCSGTESWIKKVTPP